MIVDASRRIIGFDRKIQLDWLDATAEWAAQGLTDSTIRTNLERLLEDQDSGTGHGSALAKTMTVLVHIWVDVPADLVLLRDNALNLIEDYPRHERLPLHWGMCLATYPYFRAVASTAGRLLRMQGKAALSQIRRRIAESWGDRSTVHRTVRHVVRTLVLWDVLRETEVRGVYCAGRQTRIEKGQAIGPWLLEAALANSGSRSRRLQSLLTSTELFPFTLHPSLRDIGVNSRLEIHRHGLDEDVVELKRQ